MEFSSEQRKAVETDGNVIVSAGAGSGKTTVMIERIVRKLAMGAKLDQMLIVTFTRAAAADIRIKLAERLCKLKRDPDTAELALSALEDMPVCDIGTLHSFCQRLIKSYFYIAGIDPAATVAEENEAQMLKYGDIRAAVNAAWEGGDRAFVAMYDALSSRRDDAGVVETVAEIVDFALSLPEPYEYLSDCTSDSARYGEIDGIIKSRRDAIISRLDAIKADITAARLTSLEKAIGDVIPYIDGNIDEIRRTSHKARGDYSDIINEDFKRLKKDCSKFRAFVMSAERAKTLDGAPYSAALRSVALDAIQRYAKRKAALGKIDYTDLEHGARRVLKSEEARAEIKDKIKYVFIDEYQDVNPLQASIAEELKGCGAEMFLVGDIKQSIYAFRRCNPKYFKDATTDPDYTFIALNRNYRSSPQVIDFINNVFNGVMTDDFGGADYSAEKLVATRDTAGSAEFCLINESENSACEADGEDREVYSVMNAVRSTQKADGQVSFIVNRVLDWLQNAESPDLSAIAVLVRSARTEFCAKLAAAFKRAGIKCSVGRKSKLSDYPEAVGLLNILRYVDNRYDDVALYTALRSPMGGFSDEELLAVAQSGERRARENHVKPIVRGGRESYAFWQKASSYDGELKEKLTRFYGLRDRFSEYAQTHDCADTLGYITSATDYFQYVYDADGSAEAVEALIGYAADKRCDINSFIDFCDKTEFDLNVDGGGDSVTITTIHSSKGLEYDYVIVADISHGFVLTDSSEKVIASEDGVACKIPDEQTRTLLPSVPWLIENCKGPDRVRQEELRLLYVALTRAKRKLTVCGKNNKTNGEGRAAVARCELDFMGAVAPVIVDAEPVRVDTEAAVCDEKPDSAITAAVCDEKPDSAITAAVKARCEFKYARSGLPIKTCVTALAEYSEEDYTSAAEILTDDDRTLGLSEDRKESACASDGVTAAKLRGTAYHRAMELINFDDPDFDRIKDKCENSELVDGARIVEAARVMKELVKDCAFYAKERYFIADMPYVGFSRRQSDGGDSVLVQGVMDLLIVNKDGTATVVDYKTTSPERLLSDEYKTQLKIYAAAVEKVTPYKVKKAYLYSFILGKLIEI